MAQKDPKVTNLNYKLIAGPVALFTDEALVHIRDNGHHSRTVFAVAYLPTLKEDVITVAVEEGVPIPKVKFKPAANPGSMDGTRITLSYTSQKGATTYYLWQISFDYLSELDLGFEDVVLHDTDPETSRGTVTTPEDPDPEKPRKPAGR